MDLETLRQVYLLDMRRCCAEMEHVNQCSQRELSLGEWRCDWPSVIKLLAEKYDEQRACLEATYR